MKKEVQDANFVPNKSDLDLAKALARTDTGITALHFAAFKDYALQPGSMFHGSFKNKSFAGTQFMEPPDQH